MNGNKRLLYLDNIRLLVILLVVIVHTAMTYSGSGRWYYEEPAHLSTAEATAFGFIQSFLQAFYMGLLFLIAGYFVPGAYDKKGFGKFMKDRAVRLGIPALIYMFAVDPFTENILLGRGNPGKDFFSYWKGNITNGHFLSGNGPLWFAIALLFFSAVYGLFRLASDKRRAARSGIVKKRDINLGAKTFAALVVIIASVAFVIRIFFPIITSFFNMMVCFFAQYIVLFIAGILAYRHDVFSKLSYKAGLRLLCWSPLWGFGVWLGMMIVCERYYGGNYSLFNGGLTWQSALYSLWESFTAIAMDFGLLVLFREKFSHQGALTRAMSQSAFAVYVFHTPVVVAITLLFAPLALSPFYKFLAASAVCVPASFLASYALNRVPLLKRVL
jgi:glucan biosynthesis protein C